jgi:hypothetical protein
MKSTTKSGNAIMTQAPTTAEEWWKNLDDHWPNIVECFSNAGAPLDSTAWSDGIGKEVTEHDRTFIVTLETMKKERDPAMARMLNLCWLAAPDSPEIHRWPSWGVLCDLCSEEWCLYPDAVDAQYQAESEQ